MGFAADFRNVFNILEDMNSYNHTQLIGANFRSYIKATHAIYHDIELMPMGMKGLVMFLTLS